MNKNHFKGLELSAKEAEKSFNQLADALQKMSEAAERKIIESKPQPTKPI